MQLSGKILKIDFEIGFGFIKVPKHEDVFFSEKTNFVGISFKDLSVNDSVKITAKETIRGLFAEKLELARKTPTTELPVAP